MNATDVIGYVDNEACEVYCPDCVEDPSESRYLPIFATEEYDSPQHCDECGELIPVVLTSDGIEYIRDRLHEYCHSMKEFGLSSQNADVLDEWAREYLAPDDEYRVVFSRWYDGADIVIQIWEERDRVSVVVYYDDNLNQEPIFETWDDDFIQLREDGFFDAQRPREFVAYLQKDLGLIPAKMTINNIDVRRA